MTQRLLFREGFLMTQYGIYLFFTALPMVEFKGAILSLEEDNSGLLLGLGRGRRRFWRRLIFVLAPDFC